MAKLRYILLYSLMLIFIPLVYTVYTREAFMFPKVVLFYAFILLLISMVAIDVYRGLFPLVPSRFKYMKRYVRFGLSLLVLFLISFLISVIFSSDVYTSVVGYYSRFFGSFISFIALLIYFSVGYLIFSRDDIELLFRVSLVPLLPISLYGILQHFYMLVGNSHISRVYSTIGQPNWLAQYIVGLVPFVLFFMITLLKKARKGLSIKLIIRLVYYVILLFSMLLCLWYTVSLSGVVSFLIGLSLLFLYKVYVSFKDHSNSKKKRSLFISIPLVLSLLFLLVYFIIYSLANTSGYSALRSRLKDVGTSFELIREPASKGLISYTVSDSLYIRYLLWVGTFNLIKSSPKIFLIGTGPSTFAYHFYTFRPPDLNYSSEWDFVFNKPHNYYLELFSEVGLFGLMSHILLWLYVMFRLSSKLLSGDLLSLYIFISLFSMLVSYVFGWPVISDTLIFWLGIIYAFI